ncbi:hypothetical protein BD410DRAFT_230929 [Rickenella mellea]|uniref:C3H1-type domain-containing protein n=1 Tax=Rickenella mellea TaxID=50990 RepID=A0A4Y7QLQ0_9AGAM|nr:hypothetical protein BD410DRAFT_230929 [Rickenella mellea]
MLLESNREPLRQWLVKTLEPICDAEPGALSDYVLALLEHDAPEQELRKEFIGQLADFLEQGAADFVDSLFATLRSKSYLPYSDPSTTSQPPHVDTGIPIPLDAILSPSPRSPDRGVKRHLDDEHDTRGPPKGPRLNNDGQFSRYPQANGHQRPDGNWNGGGMNGRREMTMNEGGMAGMGLGIGVSSGMSGPVGQSQPRGRFHQQNGRGGAPDMPRRGICRDYHIKGYCARGAMCKYSHDDAAVAPGQLPFQGPMVPPMSIPMGAVPFMPLFNGGGMPFPIPHGDHNAAYDPHQAHMDMRPGPSHGGRPSMRSDGGGHDQHMTERPVIQDLTPRRQDAGETPIDSSQGFPREDMMADPMETRNGDVVHEINGANQGTLPGMRPAVGGNPAFRGSLRSGRGRGGTFTGERQTFHSDHIRDNKTLVVEKIPEEHLSLESVNGWFKRFGSVTNVAIDRNGGKALVSFSTHDEAQSAWKAEDAVFNNRFIKIFWHRPMEGQGAAGQRMLQASAPIVANFAARDAPSTSTSDVAQKLSVSSTALAPVKKSASPTAAVSALAAKQQLLEKQIAEQKDLMTQLSSASADEKKEIMARLRKLGEEMKPSSTVTSTARPRTPSASKLPAPPPREDKERKARELLDMELEIHAKETSHETNPVDDKDSEAEETTESLQEKLNRLRAEAEALGISDTSSSGHPHQSSYRPYRGRGRGRGSFRGAMRGGPPRVSMKLDNRPKSLLVKGMQAHDADALQAVRSWFEAGGQVESLAVNEDEGILVTFKSRNAAEQAMAKGSTIPSVGAVKLTWHAGASTARSIPIDISAQRNVTKESGVTGERPPSPHPEDASEVVGWGNGEEDGMGMF